MPVTAEFGLFYFLRDRNVSSKQLFIIAKLLYVAGLAD